MRSLLAATSLTPLLIVLPLAPASAEHTISTAITTPVATGTVNDSIRITSAGSIKRTASGAVVTMNSNHGVRNDGTIEVTGANNSTGILVEPNLTGNINNTGTITLNENYTPTDSDNDGDPDGPFAQGSNRFGIRVLGGGTHTGSVTNSGTINIEGNNSAGIAIDSALTGSVTNRGNINVIGNNSVGLRTGDVSGDVAITRNAINVQGANAVGVSLGDIGGSLVIQGAVNVTGYRTTTVPADPSKLDADDLLQGGSAVLVNGNVAGGILFDARPADNSSTDTDEDDDGVADADESTASINSFGAAPAVRIGSTTEDIVIGAVGSSTAGHGFVNKGVITGQGLYEGVAANGLVVGGTGHSVDVAGGLTNSGSIRAIANKGNATAVRIGAGASVPVIVNSGTIAAEGAGTTTTSAQAIVIDSGATVTTLRNTGNILAGALLDEGTATAVVDNSGTLTLVENRGSIAVSNAAALGDDAIAIDLRANTTGSTVRQIAVTSGAAPSIGGNILFGSGDDLLDVADGGVSGNVNFGAGSNRLALSGDAAMTGNAAFGAAADIVQLSGTSTYHGNINFGGGADSMTLGGTSVYRGSMSGAAGLGINVGSGSALHLTNIGSVAIGSLTTGADSRLGVTIGSEGATLYDVAGTASFGAGTTVDVNLLTVGNAAGTYKIVEAGNLVGADNLEAELGDVPFLFEGELDTATAGEVSLELRVKSADTLGLNRSEGSILSAVLGAADSDAGMAQLLLGLDSNDAVSDTLQQLLPEHAGGAFEMTTKGSRLATGILLDPRAQVTDRNGWGVWLQQVAWGSSKSIADTSSYDVSGWGAAAGFERNLGGAGALGVTLSYLSGKDNVRDNELVGDTYEGGVYWRGGFGPIRAFARATAGKVSFDGTRRFSGVVDGEQVTREAEGDWSGKLYSASAGVAYEARLGNRLTFRPSATIEHYKLDEDGYEETGGGTAFDLIVEDRDSSETAVNALAAIGYQLLGNDPEDSWLRLELEGGRRELLSGSLGVTRARFADGETFALTPEKRTGGFRGGLRLIGGGPAITLGAEVNAEEQQGDLSLGGRIGVQFDL